MVEVPKDEVTEQDLIDWYNTKRELASLQAKERAMRDRIADFFVPKNVRQEGTNKAIFGNTQIKVTQPYTRDIDPAVYANVTKELYDLGVDTAELVNFKPTLSVSKYRKLEGAALAVFNQCVTTKPGSVQLELSEAKPGKK